MMFTMDTRCYIQANQAVVVQPPQPRFGPLMTQLSVSVRISFMGLAIRLEIEELHICYNVQWYPLRFICTNVENEWVFRVRLILALYSNALKSRTRYDELT